MPGFINAGDFLSADLLNKLLIQQKDNKAAIDAEIGDNSSGNPRLEGVLYLDKSTSALYLDKGSGDLVTVLAAVDAAANIASPRTLGPGALQGAPGNHSHSVSISVGSESSYSELFNDTDAPTDWTSLGNETITTTAPCTLVIVIGLRGTSSGNDDFQVRAKYPQGNDWDTAPVVFTVEIDGSSDNSNNLQIHTINNVPAGTVSVRFEYRVEPGTGGDIHATAVWGIFPITATITTT